MTSEIYETFFPGDLVKYKKYYQDQYREFQYTKDIYMVIGQYRSGQLKLFNVSQKKLDTFRYSSLYFENLKGENKK